MIQKFGFIGCGNMGSALAKALAKKVDSKNILLADANIFLAEKLAGELDACFASTEEIVDECDYIFLGVKPQTLPTLFEQIRPLLTKREEKPVLISMAAGTSIARIEELAQASCGVIRIMPNTPVSLGEGMILYNSNQQTTNEQLKIFVEAMECAGKLDFLPENLIDAASALSGCGPAFVYMFAEALSDGAVACGLPRDKADVYAAQTLLGASKMLLESGKHAGELKDAVCSPGGTTIAGVAALENGAFRASAMNAVIEAYQKTLRLK